MNDITWLESISQLPLNIILMGLCVFFWRKLETLQLKYEKVLIELGKVKGKADVEVRIEEKLDQLLEIKLRQK